MNRDNHHDLTPGLPPLQSQEGVAPLDLSQQRTIEPLSLDPLASPEAAPGATPLLAEALQAQHALLEQVVLQGSPIDPQSLAKTVLLTQKALNAALLEISQLKVEQANSLKNQAPLDPWMAKALDRSPDVREEAANSPSSSDAVLTLLSKAPEARVREAVARNPNIPKPVALALALDFDPSVMKPLVNRWKDDPEVAAALATSRVVDAVCQLARQSGLPDILDRLARHPEREVVNAAAGNRALPAETLKGLIRGRCGLRTLPDAIFNLASRPGGFEWLFEELSSPTWSQAYQIEAFSETLNKVVASAIERARYSIDVEKKTPDPPSLVWRLAEAPNAPATALEELAYLGLRDLSMVVAKNPNTSRDALKAILMKKDAWKENAWREVHEAARNHPNAPEENR